MQPSPLPNQSFSTDDNGRFRAIGNQYPAEARESRLRGLILSLCSRHKAIFTKLTACMSENCQQNLWNDHTEVFAARKARGASLNPEGILQDNGSARPGQRQLPYRHNLQERKRHAINNFG
jgi:hypothetical protein